MITLLLLVRATYMYGVVLHAQPVHGESHLTQHHWWGCNTTVLLSPMKKICFYYRILLLALHIALICSTTFDQVQWHNQRFEPGGNLAEGSELANTQKIVEKQEQIRYWTTIQKNEITGKHSEKRKKINLLKSNE